MRQKKCRWCAYALALTPWAIAAGIALHMAYSGGPVLSLSETVIISATRGDFLAKRRYAKSRPECVTLSVAYALYREPEGGAPSLLIPLPEQASILNASDRAVNEVLIHATLPRAVPLGKYRFRTAVAWECNALQHHTHTHYSDVFTVTP